MTVILVDGFDPYNGTGANTGIQARWTVSSTTNISMVAGRFTGQAVQIVGATAAPNCKVTLPSTYASFAMGMAIKSTSIPTSATLNPILIFESAGTTQVGIRVTTGGLLEAYRLTSTTAGTSLGTSSSGLTVNTWHYVEVEVTISDTVGVFNIYIDGVSVLALTAQDTRNGAPTTIDTFRFGHHNTGVGSTGGTFLYDDLYMVDAATKLGERRVEYCAPTADTAQKDFTPNAGGTNYTQVDEAQSNGDTDYVQASTVGNTDRYTHGGLSSTPATVDAVQVVAFAEKTDATARSIALQVKSGSTTSDGSNLTLAASYGRFGRLLLTDPDTAAAWTPSGVNNLAFGPKVTV